MGEDEWAETLAHVKRDCGWAAERGVPVVPVKINNRWRTPPEIFSPLMAEFQFDLDAAADEQTALIHPYLNDALNLSDWPGYRVWLNPPYGRALERFVRRAAQEAHKGKLVVALIPLRGRAAWWHEAVIGRATEVRCIRKRPKFLRPDGTRPKFTGSCDSCLVIWNGVCDKGTQLTSWSWVK